MTDPAREQLARTLDDARFTAVRLREAYDLSEVDWFLESIADRLRAGAPCEQLIGDTQGSRFRVVRMREGYDMAEVDALLDTLVTGLQGLQSQPEVSAAPATPPAPMTSAEDIPAPVALPPAVQESESGMSRFRRLFGRRS